MNSEKPLLVNKLILVVLSLILVCLVLLVLRAYERDPLSGAAAVTATEEPAVEEAPAPPVTEPEIVPPPQRPVLRRPPVVIPPRVVVTAPRSPDILLAEGVTAEPAEPPVVGVGVNLPGGSIGRSNGNAGGAGSRSGSVEISGVVSLAGTPPREVPIDFGPSCGRLRPEPVTTRHYVVSPEGRLANVFIYVVKGVADRHEAEVPTVFLDQVGCLFEPYVLGVQTNQKLLVRNFDPEMHNLHLIPRLNQERNMAQPAGAPPVEFKFPKTELFMRLKCDVHPWMFAYVSAVHHPFFAVTDTNGQFRLPSSLPAGKYIVTAAHLKAGSIAEEVTVGSGDQRAVEFQFFVPNALRPQSRVSAGVVP